MENLSHTTVSALRSAHAIWLMRRARALEGLSADARDEAPDRCRASLLHGVADKVWRATEDATVVTLTPQERTTLVAEADRLIERATNEIRRAGPRNLERGEEWVRTARALREVAEGAVVIDSMRQA